MSPSGQLTNVLVGGAVVGSGSLASKAAGKAAEVAASDVVMKRRVVAPRQGVEGHFARVRRGAGSR